MLMRNPTANAKHKLEFACRTFRLLDFTLSYGNHSSNWKKLEDSQCENDEKSSKTRMLTICESTATSLTRSCMSRSPDELPYDIGKCFLVLIRSTNRSTMNYDSKRSQSSKTLEWGTYLRKMDPTNNSTRPATFGNITFFGVFHTILPPWLEPTSFPISSSPAGSWHSNQWSSQTCQNDHLSVPQPEFRHCRGAVDDYYGSSHHQRHSQLAC